MTRAGKRTLSTRRGPGDRGVGHPGLVGHRKQGPRGRREGARVALPDQRADQAPHQAGVLQHAVHLKPGQPGPVSESAANAA